MGGVPFTDEFLDGPAFAALKPLCPFGQCPILEIDGKLLAQSGAISKCSCPLSLLPQLFQTQTDARIPVSRCVKATRNVKTATIWQVHAINCTTQRRASLLICVLPRSSDNQETILSPPASC